MSWDVVIVDDLNSALVDQAAEFFNEHFPGTYWPSCEPSVFRWKLGDSNPAGRGILALAMSEGVVAAVMTATRKQLMLDGQSVTAAEVGDTFTNPAFRRAGQARALAHGTHKADDYLNRSVFGRLVNDVTDQLLSDGIEIIYGTPNNQSLPGYLRRGQYTQHDELGISFWHRPSRVVFQRKFPGQVIGGILHSVSATLRRSAPPPDQSVELERISLNGRLPNSLFREFDDLWNGLRRPPGLSMIQDGGYIQHRYAEHPSGSYIAHLIRRDRTLIGFVISRRLKKVNDPGTLGIADWILQDGEDEQVLAWAIDRVSAEATGSESPALWSDNSFLRRSTLRRMGFFRNGPITFIRAINRNLGEANMTGLSGDLRLGWSDNV